MKNINLETIAAELRAEIGSDAANLAADYEGTSSYICDAIAERADDETSIYYSDIIKFISENVEAVNDVIAEFGWEGCGSDLYKAGQMAEFQQIELSYYEQESGIIKYAALMDLIYNRKISELPADVWEEITDGLDGLNSGKRFNDITDIVTEAIEAMEEAEQAAPLEVIRGTLAELAETVAAAATQETTTTTAAPAES